MDDLRVGRFSIPAAALTEAFETSGGPGGQHANRSHTAVRLTVDLAEAGLPPEIGDRLMSRFGEHVTAASSESRSQFRNRALARKRLVEKIEAALIDETPRRPTRPTRASRERRLDLKKARGETKRLRRRPPPGD